MWQKERLLNLGLRALPRQCHKLVWMDCDVIIGDEDWAKRIAMALDKEILVQPFSRLCHLKSDAGSNGYVRLDRIEFIEKSVSHEIQCGTRPMGDTLVFSERGDAGTFARGTIWAARRELFETHGFFDACIVGGGDTAIACAAYGYYEQGVCHHVINDWQREYYHAWAKPFFATVRAAVGCVEGSVYHLWHGSMQDRHYKQRHEGLRRFDFNPFRDIAVGANGTWCWSSDKPALHQYVRDYFALRREDG